MDTSKVTVILYFTGTTIYLTTYENGNRVRDTEFKDVIDNNKAHEIWLRARRCGSDITEKNFNELRITGGHYIYETD